jgi:hypothetical protein
MWTLTKGIRPAVPQMMEGEKGEAGLEEACTVSRQVQLMQGVQVSDDGFLSLTISNRACCTIKPEIREKEI